MEKQNFPLITYIRYSALVLYLSGIIIHGLMLILQKQPSEIVPLWFDYMILFLSLYVGTTTFLLLRNKNVEIHNPFVKYFFWFKVFFLLVTQITHLSITITNDNEILNTFPPWYSGFVLFFFAISGSIYYKIHSFTKVNLSSESLKLRRSNK